jgi:hypothetical protein
MATPLMAPEDMDKLVERVMHRFAALEFINRLCGAPDEPEPSVSPESTASEGHPGQILDNCWSIEEFGLFEPALHAGACYPAGDVVTIGRETMYRNVDAFCKRIRDAVTTKGSDVVRDNLHLCLRGTALCW